MSQEFASEHKYKDEDIVWVKLGPSWWPGEVKDLETLPTDLAKEVVDFKKPPLVIVKFFDEDSYEYVKSWSSIYPYNCEKKNDFIKKGMAGFRSKLPHMEKFPKDITTAELRTGGNPNILSEPIFIPEKRTNIVAEIFGTPSPKGKGLKDKKQRSPMKHSRDTAHITHRRFLGADDYKAYICIQFPGKDRTFGDSEDDEVIRINNEPEQEFTCHSCSFTTKRLEVLVLHTKSHIQGDYVPGPRRPKRPVAIRKKKEKIRKHQVGDATTETDSNSSDNDVLLPPKQKKRKTKATKTRKSNTEKDQSTAKSDESASKPKQKTDIRSDLLAEWDLSEDEMFTTMEDSFQTSVADDSKVLDVADDTGTKALDETMNEATSMEEDVKVTVEAEVTVEENIITIEEEIVTIADDIVTIADDNVAVADDIVTVTDDIIIVADDVTVSNDVVTVEEDAKEVEQETKTSDKPKMDKETQEAIKSCFDFDEDDEEEHAIIISTPAASGRKIPRVIPPTERRRSDDDLFAQDEEEVRPLDKEEILKVSESFNRKSEGVGDEMDATFKELMKETAVPELPEVRNELKCEQNFHCVKTIKFPDKPEETKSTTKRKKWDRWDIRELPVKNDQSSSVEKKEPTKLINPKKRFAKSFEDFENEIRRKEQQLVKEPKINVVDVQVVKKTDAETRDESQLCENEDSSIIQSEIELKTQILSRIVEEAKINEESKIKIMSKMQKKNSTPPRIRILRSQVTEKIVEIDQEVMEETTKESQLIDPNVREETTQKEATEHIEDPAVIPSEEVIETGQEATEHIEDPAAIPSEEVIETGQAETEHIEDPAIKSSEEVIETGQEETEHIEDPAVIPSEEVIETGQEETKENGAVSTPALLELQNEEIIALDDTIPKSDDPAPIEKVIETVVEDTTQHNDISDSSKQVIEPLIVELPNDKVTETILEETEEKSSKKQSISKSKKRSKKRHPKKQKPLFPIDDANNTPEMSRLEENFSESSLEEKRQLIDPVESNETTLIHDPHVCEKASEKIEDKVVDLSETNKDEVRDDEVVASSDIERVESEIISRNEEKSGFGEFIEISDAEDAATDPNYEDISSCHNENAGFAEIQEVVSEIVNQLEEKDTCRTSEDENSPKKDNTTQSKLKRSVSDDIFHIINQQDYQGNKQMPRTELHCFSGIERNFHLGMTPREQKLDKTNKEVDAGIEIGTVAHSEMKPSDDQQNLDQTNEKVVVAGIEIETVAHSEMKPSDDQQNLDKTNDKEADAEIEIDTVAHSEIQPSDNVDVQQNLDITNDKEADAAIEIDTVEIPQVAAEDNKLDTHPQIKETVEPLSSQDVTEVPIENISKNETDEMIDTEETKHSKLTEEDSLSFGLLSQTEGEDFSPIGLASLYLPEDAILQPKKPKKRKHSRHKFSSKKRRHSKEVEKPAPKNDTISQITPTIEHQLPSELASSDIPVETEQFVCHPTDKQSSDVQVSEETIVTEEVVLDDNLTSFAQDSIPEEIVQDTTQHEQEDSTVSVEKALQSDIEGVEIVEEEIVLAEQRTETTDSDIDVGKEGEEQVEPDISARISGTKLQTEEPSDVHETVTCEEATVCKHGELSEIEQDASFATEEVLTGPPEVVEESFGNTVKCNSQSVDESINPDSLQSRGTDNVVPDTNTEIKKIEDEIVSEAVSSVESITEEKEPVIDESTCEAIEELQEISMEGQEDIDIKRTDDKDTLVQEHQENNHIMSKTTDPSEDSKEINDLITDQNTYEAPVVMEEHDSEKIAPRYGEKETLVDQRENSIVTDTRVDLVPSVIESEQTIATEILLQNDQTPSPIDANVHHNEVEIQCANNDNDLLKFSIQTNLSNLTMREELSALALTSLAELKSGFDSDSNASTESPAKNDIVVSEKISEPELVAIEANLTVVSEKDLADGQVEITTEKVISAKKTSVLSHFLADFSDSTNDSTSAIETSDASKLLDFNSKGTEFSSKAITKELRPKADTKRSNTYEQYELLDILEGNSEFDKKTERGKSFADDICDFEEHIPSQIVCSTKFKQDIDEIKDEIKKKESPSKSSIMSTTTKLMERLTEGKTSDQNTTPAKDNTTDNIVVTPQDVIVNTASQLTRKNITKLKIKPIVTAEQVIRSASSKLSKILEKPQQNVMDDIEDVEAFVIHKDLKKHAEEEAGPKIPSPPKTARKSSRSRAAGKAKILQQTIITAAGQVIQPAASKAKKSAVRPILSPSVKTQVSVTTSASLPATTPGPINTNTTQDDNVFDINSMPIVLSDEILTPESIENMPIVISGDTHTVSKTEAPTKLIVKQALPPKVMTKVTAVTVSSTSTTTPKASRPRILQSVSSKPGKIPTSMLPSAAKSGKYILVPQASLGLPQQQFINKKTVVKRSQSTGSPTEPTGNKIMIVTNQQGQQQRLLLTPAQQKMLGYQNQGQKLAKAVVKSNMLPKSVPPLEPTVSRMKASASPSLVPIASQVMTTPALAGRTKKVPTVTQKVPGSKTPKTILITTKHGQTVKKITTTDDDIEKQVAAQLEAIKASAGMKFGSSSKLGDALSGKIVHKAPTKRSYGKKVEPKQKPVPALVPTRSEAAGTPPPLVGTSKKAAATAPPAVAEEPAKPDRPLNQLVIQDAVGNQTTITEGQILALPNETVGGQPHSYVLVTLDHAGNLTPLNNEALMSLDPNLGLGGDLSNMVLQIDQGALPSGVEHPLPLAQPATVKLSHPGETLQAGTSKIEIPVSNASVSIPIMSTDFPEPAASQEKTPSVPEPPSHVPSTNGEPGQQLIVTGDPVATQKFLESLTEGTADLANIIANAEGKSILIQAGDQQILINANSDGQVMLPAHLSATEGIQRSERGGGNPVFGAKPNKDILAAALADTDVFSSPKIPSQMSPSGALYPMNVGAVLETSLTLGAPIMTPLEVPSTNAKKVEVDVLTQVPKNVDLPITITDPNISQTVANQQAIVNDLHSTLDLNLSGVSTAMTGPGYSFSLSGLEDMAGMGGGHKPFNSSMPLLNDEAEEGGEPGRRRVVGADEPKGGAPAAKRHGVADGSFLEVESRFTLGGEMCSSLSEPPPEMFDISEVTNFMDKHRRAAGTPPSLQSTPDPPPRDDDAAGADSSDEGSCEIPVQPKIVADLAAGFGAGRRFDGGL